MTSYLPIWRRWFSRSFCSLRWCCRCLQSAFIPAGGRWCWNYHHKQSLESEG